MKRLLSATLGLALLVLVMPYNVRAGGISHNTANNVSCPSCHNSSSASNSTTFNSNCLSCHGTNGSASHKLADTDQANTSHKWAGNVIAPAAGAQTPAIGAIAQVANDYTSNQLACVDCHIPPGITSEFRKKYEALSMVVKYFTGTYSTNPWTEIDDVVGAFDHLRDPSRRVFRTEERRTIGVGHRRSVHRRVHFSRIHRQELHARVAQLLRPDSSDVIEGGFRHSVRSPAGVGDDARVGSDVQDELSAAHRH